MNANNFIVFILLLAAPWVSAQNIELQDGAFRVTGWQPNSAGPAQDWSSVLSIYAADGDAPPMLGKYAIEDGSLVFHPRFPLASGVRYRAIFQPPGGSPREAWFDGPKRDSTRSTRVVHIYPSEDVLPSNTLRMYVYFSAPMSRGEAWKRIHVLDQDGNPIELPFLVIDQELWDPAYQRLTLLFDPGRIKRGLVLNQQMGPPIAEGKQYTLVIDREWLDARGVPLAEGFRKPFRGGPADRTPPALERWRVSPPKAGTLDALTVDFPKPMDYGLMQRLIDIPGVNGTVSVDRGETQWRFAPSQPWKPGDYQLSIDTSLEDLAGNRIDRPFDVDISLAGPGRNTSGTAFLSFRIQ
jgi:hypothetical protein